MLPMQTCFFSVICHEANKLQGGLGRKLEAILLCRCGPRKKAGAQ